jgi:hypothetical protein
MHSRLKEHRAGLTEALTGTTVHQRMDLEYTVGADKLGRYRTWVDASYATHQDMKSHTGGAMSFGRGNTVQVQQTKT